MRRNRLRSPWLPSGRCIRTMTALWRKGSHARQDTHRIFMDFATARGRSNQEKLFLSNTPIVTESGVREAQVDLSMPHAINITLNTQASKTMKEATSAMKVGKDRIAIVVEGRVVNAPCVMAVISQSMIINSLHGEQDARPLVRRSQPPRSRTKDVTFLPGSLTLISVHPDSDRLAAQGVASPRQNFCLPSLFSL